MRQVAFMRRTGLTLVSGLVLSALLVGTANAADCQGLDLNTFERTGNVSTVRTGIVGTYLWVQVGEYVGQMPEEGSVSHEIPEDAVTATACPDGSVSFNVPEPAPVEVVIDVEPQPELVDEIVMPFEAGFSLLPA